MQCNCIKQNSIALYLFKIKKNQTVMKNIKKLLLTGVVGLISTASFGQFTLSGEIRPRAEYRHGYKSVADSNQASAFSIDQRTRINLDYKVEDYQFFVSIQDIRTWGSTSQLNKADGFLSVHEAWAKANFNKNLGLKVGRQEIILDDHRIFGNVGWLQQARSHDAAILQYKKGKSKLDIAVAFNQNKSNLVGTDYTLAKSYRDMQYVWFNHEINKKINMSLLFLNLGQQVNVTDASGDSHKSINYTQTIGTHTKFNFGKLKMNFNGYYQMGSPKVTPVTALSAYLIGLDVKYDVTDKFNVGLGFETQSGTSQTDTSTAYTEKAHSFSPFFGTNHKFNGYMDYFYVGSGHGNVGLNDAYLTLKYKTGKWAFGLNTHMFLAAADVLDQVEFANSGEIKKMNSMLGTEFDFYLSTKINKSVTIKAGYSHLLATETLASLKGVTYTTGPDAGRGRTDQINNWGYVMLIFKPTFLFKK